VLEDFLLELRGLQGRAKYREMALNDATAPSPVVETKTEANQADRSPGRGMTLATGSTGHCFGRSARPDPPTTDRHVGFRGAFGREVVVRIAARDGRAEPRRTSVRSSRLREMHMLR
jgi:hypothetical protein